jgi:site-specific recombinase XerD
MLEKLFFARFVLARMRSSRMGDDLERFAAYLIGRGYTTSVAREYLNVAEHFWRWLGRRPLSRAMVRHFIGCHLPACRCPSPAVRQLKTVKIGLNRLLEHRGLMPPAFEFPGGFIGKLLRHYEERLVTARGLVATTAHNRVVYMQTMLTDLGVRRAGQLLAWTPEQIERYVCRKALRHSPATAQMIACAARSFLRFLLQEGLIHRDLSAAVPTIAQWRLAPLPETLREEELARLIKAANVRTPLGRRNRAMLLCMTELGMRASDVAYLELDGIDLTARVLRLHHCKGRRSAAWPISDKLARAIDAYLRHGRPKCPSPRVFLVHRAPIGTPLTPNGVCYMVLGLAERAGLRDRIGGTHILRHTVASRMLNAGATLKQVADLLGHQSIDTTMIYAKVDLNSLARVALPWPGAKEVRT